MIIINRHNYEEYFLLYVDNELAAEDQLAVDRFIRENPDLGEELDMVRQAILPLEHLEFEHKASLFNQEEGITSKNYETYFLLAVDQELSTEQNEEVERFVLKHPELQTEFILLQQTRLDPEPIEFAGKEGLYRNKKERAVIIVKWVRMSAAAAIIGLVALAGFLFNQHTDTISKGRMVTIDKVKTTMPSETKVTLPPVIEQQVAVLPKQQQNREEKILVKNESKKYVKINKETSIAKASNPRVVVPVEKVIKKAEIPDSRTRKQAFEDAIASAKIPKAGNANVLNETLPNTSITVKK